MDILIGNKRKKQILKAMQTRKDLAKIKRKRRAPPTIRNVFEDTLRRIRDDTRTKGPSKLIELRPGFKALSYSPQCRISDILALEALFDHHEPFNRIKPHLIHGR